jgi:hypothetical protein
MKIKKKALTIIIIGIILIVVSPILLTRNFGFISFLETGNIGDTIGGITAPITSLIGSILVFYALKAQIDANELIYAQFEYQKLEESYKKLSMYITNQLDFIRQDINDLNYRATKTTGTGNNKKIEKIDVKGTAAIREVLHLSKFFNYSQNTESIFVMMPNLKLIQNILERLLSLMKKIDKADFKTEDKNHLLNVLDYTYLNKLEPFLKEYESERRKLSKGTNINHGIPEEIYEIYDKINERH